MGAGRSETSNTKGSYRLPEKADKVQAELLLEWVLPGLFILILLGCMLHMGFYAVQGSLLPATGFQYATSAFPS